MSSLIKWFEKRRENRAITTIQRHLTLTTGIVEDLERAIDALIENDKEEIKRCIKRVASGEEEADSLRRKVMDEISRGELSPADRADLMDLVKRIDMVADWTRESTRVLNVLPSNEVPESIKREIKGMVESVKGCASSLLKCVNKMMVKAGEALQAADKVEREEEEVDELHEKIRRLLVEEKFENIGIAILISQLIESIEMIADSCEDACDQVRVIIVRK